MQPIPYIFLKDSCAEAFAFWAEVFHSPPPELFPAGDQVPDAPPGAIMHASLRIGEGWIYGSDDFSGDGAPAMAGVSINVTLPDKAEAERVFAALSKGGEVRQPLMETFFAPAFGTCSDRFGVRWMIMAAAPEN